MSFEVVPSHFEEATQQRISNEQALFQAFALVAAQPPDQLTLSSQWEDLVPEDMASSFTELIVGSFTLTEDGQFEYVAPNVPDGSGDVFLHTTNLNAEVVAALLDDETAQAEQIEVLVDTAVSENLTGINLDYQPIDATQKDQFTTFVNDLAEALDAEGKTFHVTLQPDQDSGQDWVMIGKIADAVYISLHIEEEPTIASMELLDWATDQVDRSKLVAWTHTNAVEQIDESYRLLSDEEALAHFGEMEFVEGSPDVEPETAVAVALSGEAGSLEWDGERLHYFYTYEDEDGATNIVQLSNPAALLNRLETAVHHNLKEVGVTGLDQLSDPTSFVEALDTFAATGELLEPPASTIIWTILDEDGEVIASDSESNTSFAWEGSSEPGEFTINVDYALGDSLTSLDSSPIVVAAADEESEITTASSEDIIEGVVKRNANIRVGPGENHELFPIPLIKDDVVEILGRDEFGYWLFIGFENIDGEQTAWIATTLLDVDADLDVTSLEHVTDVASGPANVVADSDPPPAATPAPPPPSAGPAPPVSAAPVAVGGFELGGQTHSFSNPALMSASGMNWVKFQHKWGEGSNPNELAGRINNAHGAGFKVLLSIPGANTYPESINFEEYVQFLAGVAALGPDAIEVWNEMNIDFEWPAGQIDPASYVNNMLAPAYNAIKTANPNVMVISGAPAPTGFDNNTNAWADNRYMGGMLVAGGGNYADCIGAHYNAGASSPSLASGHPTGSAHYSWYLLPTLRVYSQFGKPVCFTELGYLSGQDYGGVPERFGWAANTTVDQHAAWLAEAVSVAANTGNVRMIIVFNVDFTHWGDDPQAGYAMIRENGGCPACDTLAQVMGR